MRSTEVSIVAIRPISVSIPVAVTTMDAVPRVTAVFWNSRFVRSPSATSERRERRRVLRRPGALSPVSAASCASRVAERMIRPSAGTRSPASSWTRSPGTRPTAGTSASVPSRTTFACGTWRFESASTLSRAFTSWRDREHEVEHDQERDDDRRRDLADREAHHDHREEHEVHRDAQLLERDLPDRRRWFGGELVRSVPGEPRGRLGRAQAAFRVRLQRGHRGVRRDACTSPSPWTHRPCSCGFAPPTVVTTSSLTEFTRPAQP